MMRRDPLRDPGPLIRRVYAYVAHRIGPGPEAEDVTSETFERALRYRSSYDPVRGEPAAWLIGIARRRIAERTSPEFSLAEPPNSGPTLADAVAHRVDLASALGRIGDRDRELLALRYVADLSTRAIAELLEMHANAVDVALHRARARLRQELDSTGEATGRPTARARVA